MNKKIYIPIVFIISVTFSGCTQLITAPISLAGSMVSTGIGIGSSVVKAAASNSH